MSNRDLDDPRYVKWRKAVFFRDHFKCQFPGCPGACREIEAHHIVRWVDSERLRLVVSNGITLCLTHHEMITGREREFERKFKEIVKVKEAARRGSRDAILKISMLRYAPSGEEGPPEVPGTS